MAQEATTNEQKKFKVPRIPGDIMIYPMIVGLLLNTFCPQVFEIGGFFTAACRGGSNTIVAAILLFVGAGISFKSTPGAIKTGIVVLIPKLVVAAALGLGVAYFFNDNFLGLSSVSIIGGITFCNMALYTGIMGEFGDESEQGAVGILFFTAGPAVTMIILGVSGLANIPVGTVIHNIEMHPGKGAQLVRSAGTAAQLMAKENGDAQIRMPSGEVRIVRTNCMAVIGQVGNIDHENVHIGKAGRKRHMGVRPTVRGSVMNPNDHPHGGGEGKSPVGHPGPMTPWGKPAMGYKTRSKKNPTNKFIVKRRNDK